jgi:hypothetical protein
VLFEALKMLKRTIAIGSQKVITRKLPISIRIIKSPLISHSNGVVVKVEQRLSLMQGNFSLVKR